MSSLVGHLRYFLLWSGWRRQANIKDMEGHPVIPFIPPDRWRLEWNELKAGFINAGLKVSDRPYEDVKFYKTTFIPKRLVEFVCGPVYTASERMAGIWLSGDNSIVIEMGSLILYPDALPRHEMTHAIRQVGGHEPEYFNAGFGNIL
jgi:hypothetical protein